MNLAIFTHLKSVFAKDNVRENLLGANFYIEDVFVGDILVFAVNIDIFLYALWMSVDIHR